MPTNDTRPRLAISQCLGFKAVRYNGAIIRDDFVQKLAHYADIIELCPEVGIGLGVPRDPIRMQTRTAVPPDDMRARQDVLLFQPATRRDITHDMHAYARVCLDDLEGEVDGFILKSRSPSCGIANVGVFETDSNNIVATTAGMFAQHVLHRFGDLPVQDEMQLKDASERAHFLTHAWARARLRNTQSAADLIAFHTSYNYLLMAYDPVIAKTMGQVAERMTSHTESVSEYRTLLASAMRTPPSKGTWANAVTLLFGHVSDRASSDWRNSVMRRLDSLHEHDTITGRAAVTNMLHAMAIQLDEPYLQTQHFFQPFPSELA